MRLEPKLCHPAILSGIGWIVILVIFFGRDARMPALSRSRRSVRPALNKNTQRLQEHSTTADSECLRWRVVGGRQHGSAQLIERKHLGSNTAHMSTVRKRRLSPHPRRRIELLALLGSSPHGATEALLVRAYGFTSDMITDLVRTGLAMAERETMNAGAGPVEAVRLRITAAGRKAIEG